MSDTGLACPPRFSTRRRPERPTYGPKVAEVAERLGLRLFPWQRYVLDVALEVDPATGRLAYREVILTVPRQSGKTTLILALAVWRCLAFDRQVVAYTAQTRNAARKKWEDEHVAALLRSWYGRRRPRPFRVRKTNGNEAIIWSATQSRHGIDSNTEKAGHGDTLDLGIIDEAFAQRDDRLEQAFRPAMQTRVSPQLWTVSTEGTEESTFLARKVTKARKAAKADTGRGIAGFEWSAPEDTPDEACGDVDLWVAVMPGLDVNGGLTPVDAVRDDFDGMELAEFKRAYLNIRKRAATVAGALPAKADDDGRLGWAEAEDVTSQAVDGAIRWAVEVTPDRETTCVGIASRRRDGRVHLELVKQRKGTTWAVKWLAKRTKRVTLDPRAAAGSLADKLEAAGVTVNTVDAAGVVRASTGLYDLVVEGKARHIGQAELTASALATPKRELRDSWAFSRQGGTGAAVLAVALAAHDLDTYTPTRQPMAAYA